MERATPTPERAAALETLRVLYRRSLPQHTFGRLRCLQETVQALARFLVLRVAAERRAVGLRRVRKPPVPVECDPARDVKSRIGRLERQRVGDDHQGVMVGAVVAGGVSASDRLARGGRRAFAHLSARIEPPHERECPRVIGQRFDEPQREVARLVELVGLLQQLDEGA